MNLDSVTPKYPDSFNKRFESNLKIFNWHTIEKDTAFFAKYAIRLL